LEELLCGGSGEGKGGSTKNPNRKVLFACTTHSEELKLMALDTDTDNTVRVENACMLSSSSSISSSLNSRIPTYKLVYGVFGNSFPIECAKRVGPIKFPPRLLERAVALSGESAAESATSQLQVDNMSATLRLLNLEKQELAATKKSHKENLELLSSTILKTTRATTATLTSLAGIESKLNQMFKQLQESDAGSLEIMGDTIRTAKLVQRRVLSLAEKLRESGGGLKIAYRNILEVNIGDSIHVFDDVHDGEVGTVTNIVNSDVEVRLEFGDFISGVDDKIQVKFDQLASFSDLGDSDYHLERGSSYGEDRDRLNSLLSSSSSSSSSPSSPKPKLAKITSSRQRKANKKKKQ